MNQNPDDLRTAGLHRGPNHIDYRETEDLTSVHAAVQREHSVGTPGQVPMPLWLMVLCGVAIFWAGTSFSGGFGGSYFRCGQLQRPSRLGCGREERRRRRRSRGGGADGCGIGPDLFRAKLRGLPPGKWSGHPEYLSAARRFGVRKRRLETPRDDPLEGPPRAGDRRGPSIQWRDARLGDDADRQEDFRDFNLRPLLVRQPWRARSRSTRSPMRGRNSRAIPIPGMRAT